MVSLVFQAAANEVLLLGKISGTAAGVVNGEAAQGSEARWMAASRARAAQQSATFQDRGDALDKHIFTATAPELPALRQQTQQVV